MGTHLLLSGADCALVGSWSMQAVNAEASDRVGAFDEDTDKTSQETPLERMRHGRLHDKVLALGKIAPEHAMQQQHGEAAIKFSIMMEGEMQGRCRGFNRKLQLFDIDEAVENLHNDMFRDKMKREHNGIEDDRDASPFNFDYAQHVLKPYIKVDDERKRLLKIAGEDDGAIKWNILFTVWTGSALKFVLQDSFFYIQQACLWITAFGVFAMTKDGMLAQATNTTFASPQDSVTLPKEAVTSVSIAFGLFLSFYASNQYKRFWSQYFVLTSLQGRCFEVATAMQAAMRNNTLLSLGLDEHETAVARRSAGKLVRFINATHILGYSGLCDRTDWKGIRGAGCCHRRCGRFLPSCCGCFRFCRDEEDLNDYTYDSSWVIALFVRLNLLETKELYHLIERFDIDTGGAAYRHMCAQAHGILIEMYQSGHINKQVYEDCKIQISMMRGKFGTLYDYRFQSTPLLYVNTLLLLTMMYLVLFAGYTGYAFGFPDPVGLYGWTAPPMVWWHQVIQFVFAWLGFIMLQVALLTMLQASLDMSNPWGMDLTDLCVTDSVIVAATNCKKLYNWDNYMKLHAQKGIGPDGREVVRYVAPLVAHEHDDLRGEELEGTEAGFGRCKRRFKQSRPMLIKSFPEGEVDLDFGEAGQMINSSADSDQWQMIEDRFAHIDYASCGYDRIKVQVLLYKITPVMVRARLTNKAAAAKLKSCKDDREFLETVARYAQVDALYRE